MLAALTRTFLIVVALFLIPLGAHALWWAMRDDIAPNWGAADWSSAKLLPAATEAPEAIVAVYAARVGRWRGIFAHHTWVVVKEAGARTYTRYDKVGWGSPVRTNGWAPDGRWFGNAPHPVVVIKGPEAERLIPQVRQAVASYPYQTFGAYNAWPGPNSNTFVAHVMRSVPELASRSGGSRELSSTSWDSWPVSTCAALPSRSPPGDDSAWTRLRGETRRRMPLLQVRASPGGNPLAFTRRLHARAIVPAIHETYARSAGAS
jgi:hypothetical protein